jgi:dihydroorotase-like cyclic amidohydrolase
MKKKFYNARFYRNDTATEMIVENGKISQIGTNLPKCEEEIDLGGSLFYLLMLTLTYTWITFIPCRN